MIPQIYKPSYRVRRASLRGKEVTLPSGAPFKPGDTVIVFYDGFVLYVSRGTRVDEARLREAIRKAVWRIKRKASKLRSQAKLR